VEKSFEVTEQPARPTLYMKTVTPVADLPQKLGEAFRAIAAYLEEIGASPPEATYAAYFNMDMNNLEVEMGFLLCETLAGKDDIQAGEIPAGKQLSYIHRGPYSGLEEAYRAMGQWLQENNLTPTGVSYEFYYNSPMEVPESELVTKIVFPLV